MVNLKSKTALDKEFGLDPCLGHIPTAPTNDILQTSIRTADTLLIAATSTGYRARDWAVVEPVAAP